MECKRPSIMAPNGSCERTQENAQFQQSVLVSTFQSLSAAGGKAHAADPEERRFLSGGRVGVIRQGG